MYTFFACGFLWVQNLFSDIKGGTQTEGTLEQCAEKNIWDQRGTK
jgi:hypothetical protein